MLRARKNRQHSGTRSPKAIAFCLTLSCLWACTTQHDPQAVYDRAQRIFQHGDLRRAEEEAKKGYDNFHAMGVEWAWKFRVLQSNALVSQGKDGEVLALLASEPAPPFSGELAVQKQRLEGIAYASSGNATEAQKRLAAAERLCATSETPACSSVVSLRGWM